MRRIWFDEHEESVNNMCAEADKPVSINWATDGRKWVEEEQLRENWIQELSKVQVDREGLANTAIIMDNNAKIGWINQFFNLEEQK